MLPNMDGLMQIAASWMVGLAVVSSVVLMGVCLVAAVSGHDRLASRVRRSGSERRRPRVRRMTSPMRATRRPARAAYGAIGGSFGGSTGCHWRGSSRYSRAKASYSNGASAARAWGRSMKASVATAKNSAASVAP